jgi:F-type H+-transporting ATPase subunit b
VELNWSTVILEIINFLVLVWILKHFLYRPVLNVIEQRRVGIEATLSEAKQREEAAEKLRAQFENRLAEWQQDKEAAREQLQREIQQQRQRALAELEEALDAEREKTSVVEQRRARELEEGRERAALKLGARFATRLLERLSGPPLEARIVELFSQELTELDGAQREALRRAVAADGDAIEVHSAFALDATQRQELSQALEKTLGRAVRLSFVEEPDLIAGLSLSLGDWAVGANLRDELKSFVDQSYELG